MSDTQNTQPYKFIFRTITTYKPYLSSHFLLNKLKNWYKIWSVTKGFLSKRSYIKCRKNISLVFMKYIFLIFKERARIKILNRLRVDMKTHMDLLTNDINNDFNFIHIIDNLTKFNQEVGRLSQMLRNYAVTNPMNIDWKESFLLWIRNVLFKALNSKMLNDFIFH